MTSHPAHSLRRAKRGALLRILVVDDDESVREPLSAGLSTALGAHVEQAESIQQAIELLNGADRFDVIVSDYSMPGKTGLDLYQYIQEHHPSALFAIFTGTPLADLPSTTGQFLGVARKPDAQGLVALIQIGVCLGPFRN